VSARAVVDNVNALAARQSHDFVSDFAAGPRDHVVRASRPGDIRFFGCGHAPMTTPPRVLII